MRCAAAATAAATFAVIGLWSLLVVGVCGPALALASRTRSSMAPVPTLEGAEMADPGRGMDGEGDRKRGVRAGEDDGGGWNVLLCPGSAKPPHASDSQGSMSKFGGGSACALA